MAWLTRFAADRRGTTAIEFAVLLPPLCLVMFGALGFGYVAYLKNDIDQALAMAKRMVFVDPDVSEARVRAAVLDQFAGDGTRLAFALIRTPTGSFQDVRFTFSYPIEFPLIGVPFVIGRDETLRL